MCSSPSAVSVTADDGVRHQLWVISDDATIAALTRAIDALPALYIADDLAITFTGGRKYRHPRETTAFNAKRYKWVKKKMERTDVVAGEGETIVYNLGTLYGEWPDGTPFEGNRYVDRFVVRDGKIVQMDVWNDSAERLLTKAGIEA